MTGIYIHIPFCVRKCSYCDFFSVEKPWVGLGAEPPRSFVQTLVRELNAAKADKIFAGGVDTVYVGGGTPTALPPSFLCEILQAVHDFPLRDAEITVEANPGTLDAAYLAALKSAGVTRLSIGLQAVQPELLHTLGRIHTMADFADNFQTAREAGFANINVDLMFALPGQTPAHWAETLREVIALSPEHISAYALTPAENTPLYDALERDEITLPSAETDRAMYHEARRILANAGYVHYEISNFAKPGYQSRHNVNCWRLKPYIGFGPGAHSFDGKSRWETLGALPHPPHSLFEKNHTTAKTLTLDELLEDEIILGLRLMEGVPEEKFAKIYPSEIAQLKKDGLLKSNGDRLCLTTHGLDFANQVFIRFLRQPIP